MSLYKRSTAAETIVLVRPITTTTTILAYGSGDGYTEPGTLLGIDEDIMVAGTVAAEDGADLTGLEIDVRLNGPSVGKTPLYGYDGVTNYYQLSLGMLPEGTHTVEAVFPRARR